MTEGERKCAELLDALGRDSVKRLKWRVMERLHICPASARGRFLTKRRALEYACHLALDAGERASAAAVKSNAEPPFNPGFDMARFRALAGR